MMIGETVETGLKQTFSPMPKSRLVSIVEVIRQLAAGSNGKLTISEIAQAFFRVYDGDAMMIFDAGVEGLAATVGDDVLGSVAGHNKRVDIASEVFNSRFWDPKYAAGQWRKIEDFMVLKEDAELLSRKLRSFFDLAGQKSEAPENRSQEANPDHHAHMAEIGTKGANSRHKKNAPPKDWATAHMKCSSRDEARRLLRVMPEELRGLAYKNKDPETMIYRAIRKKIKQGK